MAVLITSDGVETIVKPANGQFTLEELQGFVGGWIELIRTNDGRQMWLNEEGKLNRLPLNWKATLLTRGIVNDNDVIVGDVLITNPAENEIE
jgi:hypothetical protein